MSIELGLVKGETFSPLIPPSLFQYLTVLSLAIGFVFAALLLAYLFLFLF